MSAQDLVAAAQHLGAVNVRREERSTTTMAEVALELKVGSHRRAWLGGRKTRPPKPPGGSACASAAGSIQMYIRTCASTIRQSAMPRRWPSRHEPRTKQSRTWSRCSRSAARGRSRESHRTWKRSIRRKLAREVGDRGSALRGEREGPERLSDERGGALNRAIQILTGTPASAARSAAPPTPSQAAQSARSSKPSHKSRRTTGYRSQGRRRSRRSTRSSG